MWLRDVIFYQKIAVTCSPLFEREAGCSALREREAGRSVVGVRETLRLANLHSCPRVSCQGSSTSWSRLAELRRVDCRLQKREAASP